MATLVFLDGFVEINGVDLSPHVAEVTVNRNTEMVDDTAMGDTFRSNLPGLQTWDMDILFHQDYSTGAVDDTIFPILACAAVCFELRPRNVCTTVINPSFSGEMAIESYPPIGGRIGELMDARMTARSAGGTITKASSS